MAMRPACGACELQQPPHFLAPCPCRQRLRFENTARAIAPIPWMQGARFRHPFRAERNKPGEGPPPLCDFIQWLDTEQSTEAKEHVERETRWAAERWQRMLQEEKMEEKRKKDKEEIQMRFADVERRQAEEREADRERKRERTRRAKEAGPEAIRKGKYPRYTQ
ncbi:hypothetical protein PVAP13_1NG278019 [Panicum virgatum]|uniref:Uncharacterized protein n=1 Tax=Panicum virgatum TaxID=38727 RepID=A0A8T0WVD9_PANVG|nr:hypothetical protein PVAP13_1NG278019 [Panicum virgatum]